MPCMRASNNEHEVPPPSPVSRPLFPHLSPPSARNRSNQCKITRLCEAHKCYFPTRIPGSNVLSPSPPNRILFEHPVFRSPIKIPTPHQPTTCDNASQTPPDQNSKNSERQQPFDTRSSKLDDQNSRRRWPRPTVPFSDRSLCLDLSVLRVLRGELLSICVPCSLSPVSRPLSPRRPLAPALLAALAARSTRISRTIGITRKFCPGSLDNKC